MDGDGYTDLSGGLLYFISDGVTRAPGGQDAFGVNLVYAPGQLVSWSGDYDPGIGGHGTLTASNVVGQGVNGNAPTFSDLPGDGKYPGAVIGGAPHAACAVRRHLFLVRLLDAVRLLPRRDPRRRHHVELVRQIRRRQRWLGRGEPGSGLHLCRVAHDPAVLDGNGAPGFGRSPPPSPTAGIAAPDTVRRHRLGFRLIGPIRSTTRKSWSGPISGFGANGTNGVDIVADGAYLGG